MSRVFLCLALFKRLLLLKRKQTYANPRSLLQSLLLLQYNPICEQSISSYYFDVLLARRRVVSFQIKENELLDGFTNMILGV